MGKLLIVSNRLPVTVIRKKGKLNLQPSVGGLATGLASVLRKYNVMGWMARHRNEKLGRKNSGSKNEA